MKQINSLEEFSDSINQLTPREFEEYVYRLLVASDGFEDVKLWSLVDNRQVDILAVERVDSTLSNKINWAIEIKKYKSIISVDIIDGLFGKWQDLKNYNPDIQLLLVAPSGLSSIAAERAKKFGIKVWGLEELYLRTPKQVQSELFNASFDADAVKHHAVTKSKASVLIASLSATIPGKKEWSKYQQITSEILEYLFCPPLETPKYELSDLESRNRRDMIYENSATNGFWRMIRETYTAHYIVVDSKNYKNFLTKRPIIDVAHYLKPYGCGMFGMIVSRKGGEASALHAVKEQWIGNNKLILMLSDNDLIEMLQIKEANGNPESVLRRKIADFRMSL